ncbi:MlaC/ttg2D family ABC transporter substrate-binding protein [Sulfurirhabdus autotrophica]|uniref:Phospholipid transport system substrate-binding protein n=1 Tax=Sulfurirhabdus autotrophica TaxID=1706046 RepID=A0A4R3XVE8_9PROT|nr:ABC transporter substrate-binding protein [Sulfurirhabdus autotrophica]TCV83705.1 phospholipid transport system substrate-binding protein [Sulfurirhabdus autotrophica]
MNFINRMLIAALFFGSFSVQAADMTPDALAKNTTQEVLALIKQDKDLAGNQEKLHKLIEAKILPHFDFARMTRLAVGKNWRSATAPQQESLVKEFRTLLVRTYSNSLAAYKNQVIDFKPFKMQPDETDVTVKTQVVQPGAQPIPIDYAMEKTADGWKVYDVTVDGVSLVINYRSSFSSEVRQSGIDGLIKTLVEKNQSASGGSQSTAAKK